MVSDRADDAPIAGILEKVEAQTSRAADIVKRLRAFIDRREIERRRENLNSVIEEALALGIVGPASRTTRVRLQLTPDLPDVNVDRVQIQQVIVNFVRNAVDAMGELPRRELSILSSIEGANVRVAVSDIGSGIAPEIAGKIFGAFVTTKEEGMGVGLSICKAIIENHGGRIGFKPNEGGGTTFHFTLPIADPAS
jgi:two-component system sensor kinase FixL